MSTIHTPTPGLSAALQEFFDAKCAFRTLMRRDSATGEELSIQAHRIAAAEDRIFLEMERMLTSRVDAKAAGEVPG